MPGVRFAPSPTGAFHVGNFRTAWISHAWARALQEPWVVRFEDIDTPRVLPGAQEQQLSDMRELGLAPDRIEVQSAQRDRHWQYFLRAVREGQVYPCFCSRSEVQTAIGGLASAPHAEGPVYSGHCRKWLGTPEPYPRVASPSIGWRFRSQMAADGAQDFLVARTWPTLAAAWRAEAVDEAEADRYGFVPAYQWACALDDFLGDFRLLVRAWDLENVLRTQRELQALFARWTARPASLQAVFHTALVTRNNGQRLEKRTRGVTREDLSAAGLWPAALRARFAESFRVNLSDWSTSPGWGESRRQLTLAELGVEDIE
ncbi:MAG: hypothetical protein JST16_03985 [Bdellovibrionales bacterium]|nr:hypothetical protein [Bdellovibrionales bacterium]